MESSLEMNIETKRRINLFNARVSPLLDLIVSYLNQHIEVIDENLTAGFLQSLSPLIVPEKANKCYVRCLGGAQVCSGVSNIYYPVRWTSESFHNFEQMPWIGLRM